jgi:hypothetical protein
MPFVITIVEKVLTASTATPWAVVDKQDGKEVYGYLPPPPTPRMEKADIQVYQQTVDELDLPAVILAVNKLEAK